MPVLLLTLCIAIAATLLWLKLEVKTRARATPGTVLDELCYPTTRASCSRKDGRAQTLQAQAARQLQVRREGHHRICSPRLAARPRPLSIPRLRISRRDPMSALRSWRT